MKITRLYWHTRMWNKFKSLFKKPTPVIPPEIVALRFHKFDPRRFLQNLEGFTVEKK